MRNYFEKILWKYINTEVMLVPTALGRFESSKDYFFFFRFVKKKILCTFSFLLLLLFCSEFMLMLRCNIRDHGRKQEFSKHIKRRRGGSRVHVVEVQLIKMTLIMLSLRVLTKIAQECVCAWPGCLAPSLLSWPF